MYDYVICEGAGGLYVPLNEQRNYHFLHLIQQSQLPVVLVARTKIGTINHTLLSLEALKMKEFQLWVLYLMHLRVLKLRERI